MIASPPSDEPHTMRCLEVWGGNRAVDNAVVMSGLDAWLYSRPYRNESAGGDIHYISSCAAGTVTRILVADVCGHGEVVADAAHRLGGLTRRYVNFVEQTKFIEGLNSEFSSFVKAGVFATAVAATYVGYKDELTVCNAGHPRPLWYRSRTRTWAFMSDPEDRRGAARAKGVANIPLGIARPTQYDQFAVKLSTGDLVMLYTDSLIETKGPDGRRLGEEGLLAIVRQLEVNDAAEFRQALLRLIDRYGAVHADDVTLLILRPNGQIPRASISFMLKFYMRMAVAFVESLRADGREFPETESGFFSRLGQLSRDIRRRWPN